MILPTDSPVSPPTVGVGGGEEARAVRILPAPGTEALAALTTQVRWQRYCEVCDQEELFVAVMSCSRGLIGVCIGCANEVVAPWTRTNSEVA